MTKVEKLVERIMALEKKKVKLLDQLYLLSEREGDAMTSWLCNEAQVRS